MNDEPVAHDWDHAPSPSESAAPSPANLEVAANAAALEQRICRLEDAVAHLQDTRPLEERVIERVTERVQRQQPTPGAAGGAVIDANRSFLPSVVSSNSAYHGESGGKAPNRTSSPRRPWLLVDMVADARAIFRMFVDPRYHLSWRGRLLPFALTAVILTSSFWIPGTGLAIVGPLFDKILNLVLAFVLYKILAYEARRYRETAPDLPPSLRL
ncbi:MAG: hypothetical protein ACJ8FY_04890 [Gemmataceae bacterium]